MTHLYYATFLLALWVFKSDACLFPDELTGTWYSSVKGTLNMTSNATTTSINGWYFDKTEFGAVDLSCYTSSGYSYVFQSSIFTYHGLQFYGYVCFVLNRLSDAKYMYNIGSVENSDADNERVKTVLVSTGAVQTVASVCDRSSYHTGSENIFLKNDGLEEDSKLTLPYQMRGTWNYTFNSGSGDLCGTDSEVNTCNSPDSSTFTYNYTMCSTVQAYSATGVLYLMYYVQASDIYYMTMYNTDTTTDESTTYRFTCYVIQVSGTTLYATQYPRECLATQTSTSVASPGATVVFDRIVDCPYDTTSTVLSTAATAGIIIAVLILIAIVVAAFLIWYYYKKRKEKEARDQLPLQKSQPANKKLANGELYKNGHVPRAESKTPRRMQNGDVKINMDARMDDIASIRREDSICLSMASRGPSVLPGQSLESASRNGPAPVEEPEKVNENAIDESDNETTLASTFLPISPAEKQLLNFSPRDVAEKQAKLSEKEEKEIDMDDIDDELGLPRLSRAAFTPVIDPEPAPLPTLIYKKPEVETESEEERTKDGIKKVKLKKKKKRVKSAKDNLKGARPKSATNKKTGKLKEFPFLERIKKQESECNTPIIEVKPRAESEQSAAKLIGAKSPGRALEPEKPPSPEIVPSPEKVPDANEKEVKRARSGKSKSRPKTGSKYLVDAARDQRFRPTDKGALRAPASEQRRRFGDLPTSSHRKRTPRLRHPMEVQGDGFLFETPSASPSRRTTQIDINLERGGEEEKEIRQTKKEVSGKEERRTRSGRRRENPEGTTISSVKEDPFDHRDRPFTTSTLTETRAGKSAGLRLDRENSAFIDPPKKQAGENVWNKVSNMWIFKNQPSFGNIGK